jgi:hypothetical protein
MCRARRRWATTSRRLPTNSLSLVRSISGNGTVLPSITLTATPLGSVSCYAVTETIVSGSDAVRAGNQRGLESNEQHHLVGAFPGQADAGSLTYQLSGPAGTFPLAGQGSFDGYPATATGATAVTLNPAYIGVPTNYAGCVTGQ